LNLEVVVPVRIVASGELPKTRCSIGKKEQRAPDLVLLNVNSLVWTNGNELSVSDRHDDVTKDDTAEREHSRETAALRVAAAISDLQYAC
jgi:hypothetical protein